MAGDELDKFIRDILNQKQLSGVSPEVEKQLVADLKERLIDQINRAIIDAMPEDKMDEFNQMLDSDVDDAQIQQFVANSGVDTRQVTIETMLRFRSLYLGDKETTEG